jgi:hypothetical protein
VQTAVKHILSNEHRYGKQYCTPHTVRESQLDSLIEDEIRRLSETIIAESERYNKIVKDWIRKKPLYERQIQQLTDKIISLRQQI